VFKKNRKKSVTKLEQQAITTVIGSDMKISGDISGDSAIRVDGIVDGNIDTKNGIVLGERSSVTGNLTCDYIVIYGKLNGHIHAKGLYIKSTGVINGDLNVEMIEIEVGGKYNGLLNMQNAETNN
jgi:cytoskeletal protein CcmA (bactofilin family)